MCDIKWCKSKKPGTISVNENMDDGCWAVLICERCAKAIGVRVGDDLPAFATVRTRVLNERTPRQWNEGREPEMTPEGDAWVTHIQACEKCAGWPIQYCDEGHRLYVAMMPSNAIAQGREHSERPAGAAG